MLKNKLYNRFSEDERNYIVSAYSSGLMTSRDLSKKYNCSNNTVMNVLRNYNVEINKSRSLSKKLKGKTSSRKGAKLSPEMINLLRNINIGNKYSVGRVMSEKTKERISQALKKHYKEFPPKKGIARKEKTLEYKETKQAKERLRSRVKNLLARLTRLNYYTKKGKTNSILGYSLQEYKDYIEPQFKEGMSWFKKESFHVDHIVPIDAFIKNNIFDPKIINALINLQPLSPEENRAKTNHYEMENFQHDLEKIKQFLQL